MSVPDDKPESKGQGGWFRLPNMLVDHLADLGPLAVTVFVVLARHADQTGKCWPSIPRIAGLCGCKDRSVQMAIRRLAEMGLVTVTPVRNKRGQTSNVYTRPPMNPVKSDAPGGATECTGGAQPDAPGGRNQMHPEGRPNEEDPRKETQGTKKTSPNKFGDDDLALASFMVEVVSRIQKPAKEPNVENWADTIRLMRERDGRTIEQIRELFIWANEHHFWKANIRSPEKLREQWDRLTIQKQEGNGHANSKRAPLQTRGLRYDPAAPIADHL
ncbi:MAG: helix-turn-helix domain-containing protein [Rhodopirellula sp.]|nr:helix-turn-helix domain-containing protein [Rhodopirellula sp.]